MSQENVEQGVLIRTTGMNTTKKRRTLDERIFVRFPALFRRVAAFWSRLPLRSRLRRLILLRLVALGTSAANRRDFDAPDQRDSVERAWRGQRRSGQPTHVPGLHPP
jgi:hypothetical protein